MTLGDLGKYSMTWSVARSLCDSWACFLSTSVGRLILQCDLSADKFIGMLLNLRGKTIGLLTVSQCVALTAQSHVLCRPDADQITVHGWGIWPVQHRQVRT